MMNFWVVNDYSLALATELLRAYQQPKTCFSSFPNWDLQSNILNFLQKTNFSCTMVMYNALGLL